MCYQRHISLTKNFQQWQTEPAKKQKAKLSDITNYMTLPQQFGSHTSVQSRMAVCQQKDI